MTVLSERPGTMQSRDHPAPAQPGSPGTAGVARAVQPPAAAGPRTDRRHPGAVCAVDVRRAVVADAGVRARPADRGARRAHGGAGHATARDDPSGVASGLLAVRAG